MTIANYVVDLAIELQQIPAPTFSEETRGAFTRELFIQENLKDVATDALGNVYARLEGRHKKAKPLIVTAHLDTVFPESVALTVKKEGGKIFAPGIGDNSLGVAAMFGIIRGLRERKIELKRDTWFVANVGEEGLGDLRGMRGVTERFGAEVVAYLVLEGLAFGHIYHRAIGVQRYRIVVKTAGGHSWSDYGQPSAVHELAALVTQLTAIKLPREPRTTMNVGTFGGGTGINVLASEAKCDLDLRSENPAALAQLIGQVESVIIAASREGVKVNAEIIGQRPAGEISEKHQLVQLALECIRKQGIAPSLTCGSTDANIPLSRNIPALVMGITTGGGAHTTGEYIDLRPVERGMESLLDFVERAE